MQHDVSTSRRAGTVGKMRVCSRRWVCISVSECVLGCMWSGVKIMSHSHCNALQHIATHCKMRMCSKCKNHVVLQHDLTHCKTLQHTAIHCSTLQHTATHCNTLQHTATHCNTLQYTATHCNTLQHTARHCNTLQHTATHCNTRHIAHNKLTH